VASGAASVAAIAGAVEVALVGPRSYAVGGWPPPWGIEVVLDPLSAFMASTIALVGTLALLAAGPVAVRSQARLLPAFYALALVALTGFLGIVASGDLFNVFVFLEIAAIASYALIGSAGGLGLAAAFRYLVLGTVGASFYLLGVGLLYSLTGTLNMADLAGRVAGQTDSPLYVAGVAFVAVGLGLKMGLFPLHGWLPDAYTHAPSAVAGFLAGIGTKAAAYALARTLFYVLRPLDLPVGPALTAAGAAGILVGGVLAARQLDARRLLAYSSVSQLGYIAVGFGLGHPGALAGAYLHILNHAVMKAALFVAVAAALIRGGRPGLASLGLDRRMPITAACAVVAAASMVGVPPSGGFFSKWYLLTGATEAGAGWLVAVILLGTLLAVVYMYRLTRAVWFAAPAPKAAAEAPASLLTALVALALLVLLIGLGNAGIMNALLLAAAKGAF
jgi:multicomponent Na+:H+ antiporter subunit D